MVKSKNCCLSDNTNYKIYIIGGKTQCLEHFNLRKDKDLKNMASEKECQPLMAVKYQQEED